MPNPGSKNGNGQPRAHRYPENIDRRTTVSGQNGSRQTRQEPYRTTSGQQPRQQSRQTGSQTRNGEYRFTEEPGRRREPARQGRPPRSNRSDAGRHPQPLSPETKRKQKKAAKAARKADMKKAQSQAVTAYQKRHEERVNAVEKQWQKGVVRVRGGVDRIMLGLILLMVALGTMIIFSASYPAAMNEGLGMYYYIRRQILYLVIGFACMTFASLIPYRWYSVEIRFKNRQVPILIVGLYLLACVLLVLVLFIGTSEGVAKRWIYIGSFSFQPSELMKVALIMIMAWYIAKHKEAINKRGTKLYNFLITTLFPALPLGVSCLLIMLEKHLSGTIITGLIGMSIMLVGGCSIPWTFLLAISAGVLGGVAYLSINEYAMERVENFLKSIFTPELVNKLDGGYQTDQGLNAIGAGGLMGVGLGHSRQKYSYVSAAHTDFIFTIWCEEFGFIGAIFLISLFIVFVIRGYIIAARAPDTFTSLVVYGITTHVGLQALLNICVVTAIIPNTGIPLPFFSYGGSSLIILLAEMGILLSISRQRYMKQSELEERRKQELFRTE